MTLHKYDLNPGPFNNIKSGNKIYELRLYDERRRLLKPDDQIEFTNNVTGEKLNVIVESLHIFENFQTLYEYIPQTLYGYKTSSSTAYLDMLEYYPLEKQRKYPALAIKIRLIS